MMSSGFLGLLSFDDVSKKIVFRLATSQNASSFGPPKVVANSSDDTMALELCPNDVPCVAWCNASTKEVFFRCVLG
jgi:hypothetical protein